MFHFLGVVSDQLTHLIVIAIMLLAAYFVAQYLRMHFDWPLWTALGLTGLAALVVTAIPEGWNLLRHAFGAVDEYQWNDAGGLVTDDDLWFIVKAKFVAAIVGVVAGAVSWDKLRL